MEGLFARCLVAIELKIEDFQPEHLGKLEFYLEALDRNVRKPHERPSIGVLLCATRDDLGIALDLVFDEAATTERLGFTGRGEGIAAEAVCLIGRD